ncbi:MAG: hypothetical protein J3K34DRAFT_410756 [Monoraphidium minutum]|nr:MAG: hypothetical protein J3K34DRAFT_410756 [Monoraphidium minutum]
MRCAVCGSAQLLQFAACSGWWLHAFAGCPKPALRRWRTRGQGVGASARWRALSPLARTHTPNHTLPHMSRSVIHI